LPEIPVPDADAPAPPPPPIATTLKADELDPLPPVAFEEDTFEPPAPTTIEYTVPLVSTLVPTTTPPPPPPPAPGCWLATPPRPPPPPPPTSKKEMYEDVGVKIGEATVGETPLALEDATVK